MNTHYDRGLGSRNSKSNIGLTSKIRRQLASLPPGGMLSTRQLLSLNAKRTTLDMALYRMVKSGELQRLARGVFRKASALPFPSAEEIGKFKARAFRRAAFAHGADAAFRLGFASCGNSETTFATDGATTSFMTIAGPVSFKKVSPRKLFMGDATIGLIVRAGVYMAKDRFVAAELPEPILLQGHRQERQQLRIYADLMPSWMSDQFVFDAPRPRSDINWSRLEREYYPCLRENPIQLHEFSVRDAYMVS